MLACRNRPTPVATGLPVTRPLLPLTLAAAVVSGCQSSGNSDITSLSILLKEPPGDVEAAVITVARMELIGPQGPVVLLHQPRVIDLLDPEESPIGLLNDFSVPAASYRELRVHVRGMYVAIRDEDGTTARYATPAYAGVPPGGGEVRELILEDSGVGSPVALAEGSLDLRGDQTVLVLEFDPLRGLQRSTLGGRIPVAPRISGGELRETGGIEILLENAPALPAPGAAMASLFDANSKLVGVTRTFTDADSNGIPEAYFGLLPPGDYRVVLSPPDGWAVDSGSRPVSVALGRASQARFTLVASR